VGAGEDVGGVDVVRRRLRELRPASVRPAQRTGYRPGQVLQLDWAEMPTRPKIAGRERRVHALVASLPYSSAQTAFFSFEMTIESFLEGHARAFEWLEGVPRECVYDNLRMATGVDRGPARLAGAPPAARAGASSLCAGPCPERPVVLDAPCQHPGLPSGAVLVPLMQV
jgi:hypothetical protein